MAEFDEEERPTLPVPVDCPVCLGGRKYDPFCFLCHGLGAIDARTKARWLELGQPMTKADFHDV